MRRKKSTLIVDQPIAVALCDELKTMTLQLIFNDEQWPEILELSKGANVKLNMLSFNWEKVDE